MLTPFGSMIVGFLAGIISVLGYKYLSVRMIQFSCLINQTRNCDVLVEGKGTKTGC